MIKFLITAAFVLVFVFILFLLLSLMAWIAGKVLRSLFPDKFKGKAGTSAELIPALPPLCRVSSVSISLSWLPTVPVMSLPSPVLPVSISVGSAAAWHSSSCSIRFSVC